MCSNKVCELFVVCYVVIDVSIDNQSIINVNQSVSIDNQSIMFGVMSIDNQSMSMW